MSDPMDDFDTGIDTAMPAALVAALAITVVFCAASTLIGAFVIWGLAKVMR